MAAFGLLNDSRGAGCDGPMPIPLSEIESYCRLFDIGEPEEVAEFVEMIQAMDAIYLEAAARQRQQPSATSKVSVAGETTGARPSRRPRRGG